MNFSEIKPYVRYIQRLKPTRAWTDRVLVPRDNRLFYCLGGCGYITVAGQEYEMTVGSVVLIPAGEEYVIHTPASDLTYIAVNFDYTFANSCRKMPIIPVSPEEFHRLGLVERRTFSDEPILNSPVYLPEVREIEEILFKMLVSYSKKLLYYESTLSGDFCAALAEIMRSVKLGSLSRADSVVDAILSYIHNNYADAVTNAKIGEVFGYNRNYVSDLIKSATNLPLHKYIESVRFERALDMLTTSEMPIKEIAELCGFCDIYHFSKMFKARFGVSPRAYRKNS